MRVSKLERRFAVRSNSVRLGGNSTEWRLWSWKLVRSRTVEEGSSSSSGVGSSCSFEFEGGGGWAWSSIEEWYYRICEVAFCLCCKLVIL